MALAFPLLIIVIGVGVFILAFALRLLAMVFTNPGGFMRLIGAVVVIGVIVYALWKAHLSHH
jgi:hypothetical protein